MGNLSICIATYNRARFIGATLDSILEQVTPDIELVVVDGGSTDNTRNLLDDYAARFPAIRYFRETTNSGVDQDYDKAVAYATGQYCWLMTDDDLLRPDAVSRVLSALDEKPDLIVVNAETRTADLSRVVETRRVELAGDRTYRSDERDEFFSECANYLSFIGCVVINRALWLSRDRVSYYGSLFVHVGVIFQDPPIRHVKVLASPLLAIRLGNAMWTSRSFEIWTLKWPHLVWSFPGISDAAKRAVCEREPWRSLNSLFYNRAIGAYSSEEYRKCVAQRADLRARLVASVVRWIPGFLANWMAVFYLLALKKSRPLAFHNLLSSPHSSFATRMLVRAFRGGRLGV